MACAAQLGREVLLAGVEVDADADHHPVDLVGLGRQLGEDAGDLPALDQDVVGPLDAGVDAGAAQGVADGQRGHQRQLGGARRSAGRRGAAPPRRPRCGRAAITQARPRRPRPPVWPSATTTSPWPAPSSASALAWSLVEPSDSKQWSTWPMSWVLRSGRSSSGPQPVGHRDQPVAAGRPPRRSGSPGRAAPRRASRPRRG